MFRCFSDKVFFLICLILSAVILDLYLQNYMTEKRTISKEKENKK